MGFKNFLNWYTAKLKVAPLRTKMITSFFTFTLGDVICQVIEKSLSDKGKSKPFDVKRAVRQGSFGVVMTPYLHVQYNIIIARLFPHPGFKNTIKSVIYDQTVNSVIFLIVFFGYMDYMNGIDFKTSLKNTLIKLPPTLIANWKLWPAAQLVNFSIVPPDYRVLFSNMVGIIWNIYLSYVQNSKDFSIESKDTKIPKSNKNIKNESSLKVVNEVSDVVTENSNKKL